MAIFHLSLNIIKIEFAMSQLNSHLLTKFSLVIRYMQLLPSEGLLNIQHLPNARLNITHCGHFLMEIFGWVWEETQVKI